MRTNVHREPHPAKRRPQLYTLGILCSRTHLHADEMGVKENLRAPAQVWTCVSHTCRGLQVGTVLHAHDDGPLLPPCLA